ncbi:septum formation initiator family protein [Candidatus Pelagibacter sp.]|nr:septum formation initiator family protein [Candidatus Pelagibacter sp.]
MLLKIKKNYFTIIITFLFLYFFFNLLDGERGLVSYFEKQKILKNLNYKKVLLSEKIEILELKNSLLTTNIDLDYIEILIREKFLFGKKNDKIYIVQEK